MTDEASTTTWETLVEQYRERAKRDDALSDALTQRLTAWHDTADMLKRQRDMAEQERDAWKLRAMRAEQEWQALAATNTNLRDQLVLAEGQRDEAKMRAEAAEAERDALRKDAARLDWLADEPAFEGFGDSPLDVYELESIVAEQNGRVDPNANDRREAFRRMIDAALAVQP